MSGKTENLQLAKQKLMLKSVKNLVGESFLANVNQKIANLVQSVVLEEKTCDAVTVESLSGIVNSLKLIFEVVETSENQINITTGVEDALQFLREVLDLKIAALLPDTLQLVTVVCRICAGRFDAESLSKFYLYNLHLVYTDCEDELRLRLQVLSAIFQALQDGSEEFVVKFRDECRKQNDYVLESKLFSKLILESPDAISAQVLLTVFPFFVKLFEANDALLTVWNASLRDEADTKRFSSLCYLFDVFASSKTQEGNEIFARLLQDEQFWVSIQTGLVHPVNLVRRQALFLFKRSVQELSDRNLNLASYKLNEISGNNFVEKLDEGQIKLCNGMKNVTVCNSKMFLVSSDGYNIMWWNAVLNQELGHLFNDVFLLLETLEEKQAHIVKPILGTMIRLLGPTVCPFRNGKCLHISWILVLFQRILDHDNSTIVRWGLINLMQVDFAFYRTEYVMKRILKLLVRHCNSSQVFGDLELVRSELEKYFGAIAKAPAEISKPYFQELFREICSVKWSPEALFIVLNCLQGVKVFCLETEHLMLLKNFISTSIATQYTFLRSAVQCHILNLTINLSDLGKINLDVLADLLSAFRRRECLERGCKMYQDLARWIEYSFSKRNAEEFIVSNVPYYEKSSEKISKMICLLYDAHLFGIMKCCGEAPSCQIIERLMLVFKSFQDADKRLFAADHLLFYNLDIVRGILRENLLVKSPERSHLIEVMLPQFGDIIAFITSRSSGIEDNETAELFVDVFELILIGQRMYGVNCESYISGMFAQSLRNLGIIDNLRSEFVLDVYVAMSYLKNILCTVYAESVVPQLKLLLSYFKNHVNDALPRFLSPNTIWGRLNEGYLTCQWRIIHRLKSENLLTVGKKIKVERFFTPEELCEHAVNAVSLGGRSLLDAVLDIAEELLPELSQESRETLVQACWTAVWEMRRSDAFVPSARRFISVVFQPELLRAASCQQMLIKHSSLLLSDSINGLANALLTHAQSLKIKYTSCELWVHLLASAVVFGTSPRREDRLTQHVSTLIASTDNSANELVINDWDCNCEVRARALELMLTLTPELAEKIVQKLLEKDEEVMKKKSRTFTGSVNCTVRTRVLQSINVLEPLLSKDTLTDLYNWACGLLLKDSHQPIIRYLTEWLIVRILCKNFQLLDALWSNFTEALEQRVGSLCSFISIVYHVLSVLPDSLLYSWLDRAIMQFIPYCLSQHFTLRLYAQVAIDKMWQICETKILTQLLEKYRVMRECQLRAIGGGNSLRNAEKLAQDFYWTVFHPFNHYSLKTIYRDLPRLAHIKPDEWITPELMTRVGIPKSDTIVPLGSGDELWQHPISEWAIRADETSLEVISENMQKKMIPVKTLLPDLDEMCLSINGASAMSRKKKSADADGLIVVASLIDRPANLGGLSRTCEAFGVSELIINSLKILDDKEFQSLSVTAEKWLAVTEIKCHHLSHYLLQMKGLGYTVIGAEQTTHSQPLNLVNFPKKSILLLGSEKEGVPPQLLPLLDICVEVPQMGVVRSLNVHVTAALFVWEYIKQHTLE